MKEIIDWLQNVEHIAAEVYLKAADYFLEELSLANFLKQMAEDEAWHYHAMGSAANFIKYESGISSSISIDAEVDKRIFSYFYEMRNGIKEKNLSKDILLRKIVQAELSEWNDIFLYVVNTLREKSVEFNYPAARIQSHIKGVEYYLCSIDFDQSIIKEVKMMPSIWTESILIVDDEPSVANLLKALLNREGKIDIASDGLEALDLVHKNYYKLIITDVDMPKMDGVTFFQKAFQAYPEIKDRIIFISGNFTPKITSYLKEMNIAYLPKPMPINELRNLAQRIIISN